jgi:hypothetical protein
MLRATVVRFGRGMVLNDHPPAAVTYASLSPWQVFFSCSCSGIRYGVDRRPSVGIAPVAVFYLLTLGKSWCRSSNAAPDSKMKQEKSYRAEIRRSHGNRDTYGT